MPALPAAVGAVQPTAMERAVMRRTATTRRGRGRPGGGSEDTTPAPGNSTGESWGCERGSALLSDREA